MDAGNVSVRVRNNNQSDDSMIISIHIKKQNTYTHIYTYSRINDQIKEYSGINNNH